MYKTHKIGKPHQIVLRESTLVRQILDGSRSGRLLQLVVLLRLLLSERALKTADSTGQSREVLALQLTNSRGQFV